MTDLVIPRHLDQVWPLLEDPGTTVFAGGTDFLVKLRAAAEGPRRLVCLEGLAELQGVEELGDQVRIGAGTTHTRLLADPIVRRHFPVLTQALQVLGSPPVRNMGTIGGNICSASPAGDTLPPLYILQAEVELKKRDAVRRLPVREFILGPGRTDLRLGEILTGVWIPKSVDFNWHHYEKVGQRKALAIALVSLAALLRMSSEGLVEDIRLAWGSVGPTVITAPPVEATLRGRRLTETVLREAARLAGEAVLPIDDLRAGAAYRREVAGNLLFRLSRREENLAAMGAN